MSIPMTLLITSILFMTVSSLLANTTKNQILCDGNRFMYMSTYILGRQAELAQTFDVINSTAKLDDVFYRDELFRTYLIFDIRQNITYFQKNQNAYVRDKNILNVSGGNVKIQFAFQWEKKQLNSSLFGTGTGLVSSDIITFQKTLYTNDTYELQWNLTASSPLAITNGISLTTMQPYKDADYRILTDMLNLLKNNQTTVKMNLLKVINSQFQNILKQKVKDDKTITFPKIISYSYPDQTRGLLELTFTNTLRNATLVNNGLYLLFSQVTDGDDRFICGDQVPFQPDDPSFGGSQQFISNSLVKSVLRYAIYANGGFLDVVLNQQFWQSRAFQFYMGDVHDVMPTATKSLPTLIQIAGRCKALDDPVFSLIAKNSKSYEVKVNFECELNFNKTKLIGINIVIFYEITPVLTSKKLDFMITAISGKPAFIEQDKYKIQYMELAQFMVAQTIKIVQNGYVLGSGYPAEYRKFPNLWVKKDYLFLYDSSVQPKLITQ